MYLVIKYCVVQIPGCAERVEMFKYTTSQLGWYYWTYGTSRRIALQSQSRGEKYPLVLRNSNQIEAQTAQGHHVEQSPTAQNL